MVCRKSVAGFAMFYISKGMFMCGSSNGSRKFARSCIGENTGARLKATKSYSGSRCDPDAATPETFPVVHDMKQNINDSTLFLAHYAHFINYYNKKHGGSFPCCS